MGQGMEFSFNMCNALGACCMHKSDTGPDKSDDTHVHSEELNIPQPNLGWRLAYTVQRIIII